MTIKKKTLDDKILIGRNEWCQLPDLGIPLIKAKIDTGAKTSAIHAFNIKEITNNNKAWVCFDVYPVQGNNEIIVNCRSLIIDKRLITSSNGHKEQRYVIATTLTLDNFSWNIELTLSNRDLLRYRMLIGREALDNRTLINPNISCNQQKYSNDKVISIYSMQENNYCSSNIEESIG